MTSPFIIIDEIESALSAVETKIDTIDGIVDTINSRLTATRATYIDNIRSYTVTNNTASKTGVLSQKLAYLISLLENSTYGLNALKNASSSNSDKVYIPSSTLNTTVLSSEIGYYIASSVEDYGKKFFYYGKFTPKYDGVVKITANIKAGHTTGAGSTIAVFSWDRPKIYDGDVDYEVYKYLNNLETNTPGSTTPLTASGYYFVYGNSVGKTPSYYYLTSLSPSTSSSTTYNVATTYIRVRKGSPLYFTSICDSSYVGYHAKCNSIKIYATES